MPDSESHNASESFVSITETSSPHVEANSFSVEQAPSAPNIPTESDITVLKDKDSQYIGKRLEELRDALTKEVLGYQTTATPENIDLVVSKPDLEIPIANSASEIITGTAVDYDAAPKIENRRYSKLIQALGYNADKVSLKLIPLDQDVAAGVEERQDMIGQYQDLNHQIDPSTRSKAWLEAKPMWEIGKDRIDFVEPQEEIPANHILVLATDLNEKTETILVFQDETGVDGQRRLQTKDVVFRDKQSGKSFSLQAYAGENCGIILAHKLPFLAIPNRPNPNAPKEYYIKIPPPGSYDSYTNLSGKAFRPLQSLVVLHEARHILQNRVIKEAFPHTDSQQRIHDFDQIEADANKNELKAFKERDAWQSSLRVARKLKEEGIDVLPRLTNAQIISRIEVSLLATELKQGTHTEKKFSNKMPEKIRSRPDSLQGRIVNRLKHRLEVEESLAEIYFKDPSILLSLLRR